MLCLALYNVFIIIELSTFISIRGRKGCPIVKAHNHTALFTDISRLPGLPPLCLEKREEDPQAPSPACSPTGTKKIDFQEEEAAEGVSGSRVGLVGSSEPVFAR